MERRAPHGRHVAVSRRHSGGARGARGRVASAHIAAACGCSLASRPQECCCRSDRRCQASRGSTRRCRRSRRSASPHGGACCGSSDSPVLAGLGLAALRTRLAPRRAVAAGLAAVAIVTIEALRAPMAYTPTPALPAMYARVAALTGAVLVEYPIFHSARFNLNAPYLLAQTAHGQRIVSGYSGFCAARLRRARRRLEHLAVRSGARAVAHPWRHPRACCHLRDARRGADAGAGAAGGGDPVVAAGVRHDGTARLYAVLP